MKNSLIPCLLIALKYTILVVVTVWATEKIVENGFLSKVDPLAREPWWKIAAKSFVAVFLDSLIMVGIIIFAYTVISVILGV